MFVTVYYTLFMTSRLSVLLTDTSCMFMEDTVMFLTDCMFVTVYYTLFMTSRLSVLSTDTSCMFMEDTIYVSDRLYVCNCL